MFRYFLLVLVPFMMMASMTKSDNLNHDPTKVYLMAAVANAENGLITIKMNNGYPMAFDEGIACDAWLADNQAAVLESFELGPGEVLVTMCNPIDPGTMYRFGRLVTQAMVLNGYRGPATFEPNAVRTLEAWWDGMRQDA